MNEFTLLLYVIFDTIFAAPGWAVTWVLTRFLPQHTWHKNMPSLETWTYSQTSLMRSFDTMFWLAILITALLIFKAIMRAYYGD